MITINKGQSNKVVVTLTEKCTLTNPLFIFVFTNDTTSDEVTFTADDTSNSKIRFNEFTIVESDTPDVYNGIISLNPQGDWSYKVYETENVSPIDLNDKITMVEEGKVKVIGTNEVQNEEFDSDFTNTNTVFEG